MPRLREEIAQAEDVVIESNSVMEFLWPEVYALVVAPESADFKASARRHLERADAIVTTNLAAGGEVEASNWPIELQERLGLMPQFLTNATRFVSPEFVAYVRHRLDAQRLDKH
jgi:hypothetical protein